MTPAVCMLFPTYQAPRCPAVFKKPSSRLQQTLTDDVSGALHKQLWATKQPPIDPPPPKQTGTVPAIMPSQRKERSLFHVLEDFGPNTNNFQTSHMSSFKDFKLFHRADFQECFQFNQKQFVQSKIFWKAFAIASKYSTTSPQQSIFGL